MNEREYLSLIRRLATLVNQVQMVPRDVIDPTTFEYVTVKSPQIPETWIEDRNRLLQEAQEVLQP